MVGDGVEGNDGDGGDSADVDDADEDVNGTAIWQWYSYMAVVEVMGVMEMIVVMGMTRMMVIGGGGPISSNLHRKLIQYKFPGIYESDPSKVSW